MTYQTIDVRRDDKIVHVTLNRPEKYNAINREMADELRRFFQTTRDDRTTSVVVLQGAGKSFCTGGDLSIFPSLSEHEAALDWLAHEGRDIGIAMQTCEKTVICKVHGNCLAGGFELALMCDLVYAADDARFGLTEINMGLLPGWGGVARAAKTLNPYRAREIILSGRRDYDARTIYDAGFLSAVVPADQLDGFVAGRATEIARKDRKALRMAKELFDRSRDATSLETALSLERLGIQWLNNTPEKLQMREALARDPEALLKAQKKNNG